MPNFNQSTQLMLASIVKGMRVEKSATAIAGISTKDLFTVSGGNCLVLGLFGEVTTVVQTQACNTKFVSTPTTGSAVDMSGTVDITAHEVGGFLTLNGTLATALAKTNAGAAAFTPTAVVVAPGTIGINTAADNTGAYKFFIWYIPLEDGASIAAA